MRGMQKEGLEILLLNFMKTKGIQSLKAVTKPCVTSQILIS